MKFEIDYYFEKIEKDEIFCTLTDGKKEVMEIFNTSSEIIDKIEASGKQDTQNE